MSVSAPQDAPTSDVAVLEPFPSLPKPGLAAWLSRTFSASKQDLSPSLKDFKRPESSHRSASRSSTLRRVHFHEPATSIFLSPPRSAGNSSSAVGSLVAHDYCDASEALSSSLPESINSSVVDLGSSQPNIPLDLVDRALISGDAACSSHTTSRPTTPTSFTPSVVSNLALEEISVVGVVPFVFFMMGMSFVGVASQNLAVASMGYGIKTALMGVKIQGGKVVIQKGLTTCGSPVTGANASGVAVMDGADSMSGRSKKVAKVGNMSRKSTGKKSIEELRKVLRPTASGRGN